MPKVEMGAIAWLPDGRIEIALEDAEPPRVVELRRPTWGKFKRLTLAWDEAQDAWRERSAKAKEGQAKELDRISKLKDAAKKEGAEKELVESVARETAELVEWGQGIQIFWWRMVSDALARGEGLPQDHDEWPAELIVGAESIGETIRHWKFVPWDRGQSDRPLPAEMI